MLETLTQNEITAVWSPAVVRHGAWQRSLADLAAAIVGSTGVVALVGPAGSGKSWLLGSYASELGGAQAAVREAWQAPGPELVVDLVDDVNQGNLAEVLVHAASSRTLVLAMRPDVLPDLVRDHPGVRVVEMLPMAAADVRLFLEMRRLRAGLRQDVLTIKAISTFERRADGNPRQLDRLFDAAWRAAQAGNSVRIAGHHVDRAECDLPPPRQPRTETAATTFAIRGTWPATSANCALDVVLPSPAKPIPIHLVGEAPLEPVAHSPAAGWHASELAAKIHAGLPAGNADPVPPNSVSSDKGPVAAPAAAAAVETAESKVPEPAAVPSAWETLLRPPDHQQISRARSLKRWRGAKKMLWVSAAAGGLGVVAAAASQADLPARAASLKAHLVRYATEITVLDEPYIAPAPSLTGPPPLSAAVTSVVIPLPAPEPAPDIQGAIVEQGATGTDASLPNPDALSPPPPPALVMPATVADAPPPSLPPAVVSPEAAQASSAGLAAPEPPPTAGPLLPTAAQPDAVGGPQSLPVDRSSAPQTDPVPDRPPGTQAEAAKLLQFGYALMKIGQIDDARAMLNQSAAMGNAEAASALTRFPAGTPARARVPLPTSR